MILDSTTLVTALSGVAAKRVYSFALDLLRVSLDDGDRIVPPPSRLESTSVDGVVPGGAAGLPGPTAVAVRKRSAAPDRLMHWAQILAAQSSDAGQASLLLIVADELPTSARAALRGGVERGGTDLPYQIWDVHHLVTLSAKQPELAARFVPELTEQAVSAVVDRGLAESPDEWRSRCERYVADVRGCFHEDQLVFFLGAGVSADAGMPSWEPLMSGLMASLIGRQLTNTLSVSDEQTRLLASALQRLQGGSPLLEARYARGGLGDDFEELVTAALYAELGEPTTGTSHLLRAIAKSAVPPRNGAGLSAIVTYNFDDLVERHLVEAGVRHRSVFREGDVPGSDELGVFHVHGFLPQGLSGHEGLADSLLVFSEEGYHQLLNDPYSWSNLTQLNFLRTRTCVMIGLSMTDPNLRRLLEISARRTAEVPHFAVMKRVSQAEAREAVGPVPEVPDDLLQAFMTAHHSLVETSLRELGVNTVWVDNFDEVPRTVAAMTHGSA